jgi:hypothetical protein
MAAINVPWVAFNGGEVGKEALARVDLDPYPTTCALMENCLSLLSGAMIKAMGTEYIGRASNDAFAVVRPFVFDKDQTRVLEISDSQMSLVDGDAYVDIEGGEATIGTPVDNSSTGGSSVSVSGQNVTFTATAGGEARAYWPVTDGEAGVETTFRFEIKRRPVKIRVGTTTSAEDILNEITLYPGIHLITFTPTAATYYFRARLDEQGKALLKGMTRLAAGEFVIPTPWLEADLRGLRFRQSLDVYYLYHQSYRTRVLERRANTSWSLRLFRPTNGPFEAPNTTSTTLSPTATAGNALINANKSQFTPGSIGQLLELTHRGQFESMAATAVDESTDSIRVFGVDANRVFSVAISGTFVGTVKLQRSAGNELDWQDVNSYTAPATATIDDDLDNQIIYYRMVCSAYTSGTITASMTYAGGETTGRAEIVAYVSPTQVEVEILEAFGGTGATSNWSVGAWSDDLGWPKAGTIDDDRHLLVRDDRFFGGEGDDYESFELGVEDSDAMSRRFGAGEFNAAQWIENGQRVMIGGSGQEMDVRTSTLEEPLTPTNGKLGVFGDEGSADAQSARASANRVLFIDRTRTRLVQCLYDENSTSDRFTTDDLTVMHEEIAGDIDPDTGEGGFIEVAFQRKPQPRAWVPRDDGQLAVLLFEPQRGAYAWARITPAGTDGAFESVCVVPGKPEDRVHVMVRRTINGEVRRYHERFALQRFPVSTDENGVRTAPLANRLQSSLVSTGDPATSFTGLEHLEGETVAVWGDGRFRGFYTVMNGAIELEFSSGDDVVVDEDGEAILLEGDPGVELPEAVSTIIIGLNYEGRWKSAKLSYGAQSGTALTMDKQVNRLGVVMLDTPSAAVKYGRDFDHCTNTWGAEFGDGELMDSAVPLLELEANQEFEGETIIDPRVCLLMDTPAPVKILALVPNMELHEQT